MSSSLPQFDHAHVCQDIHQIQQDVAQIKEQTMPNPLKEISLFVMGGAFVGMVVGYLWNKHEKR